MNDQFSVTDNNIYSAATDRSMIRSMSELQVTVVDIYNELKSQRKILNQVLQRLSGGGGGPSTELPDDISFPLSFYEEVDNLERQLSDKSLRKSVVSIFERNFPCLK